MLAPRRAATRRLPLWQVLCACLAFVALRLRGGSACAHVPVRHATTKGFTLLEMLTTVSVAAVLVAIAVPSLREFSTRNQVSSSQSAFTSALAYARTEAARRGVPVFMVAHPGGVGGNEYANGWSVYADMDGDGAFTGADKPALRQHGALHASVVVHGPVQVTFQPSGALSPATTTRFKVCQPVASTRGFSIMLGPSGVADVGPLAVASTSDCTS